MSSNPTALSLLLTRHAAALGLNSGSIKKALADRGVYISPQAIRYWHSGQTAPDDAIRPAVADIYGIRFLDLSRAAAGLTDSACAPEFAHSSGKGGGAGFPFNAAMYVVDGVVDTTRLSIDLPHFTGDKALEVLEEIAANVRTTVAVAVDENQVPLFNMERA